jgi:hypothetical protein
MTMKRFFDGGGGFRPLPRDYTDAAYMTTLTDEQLSQIIQIGGASGVKPAMPSNQEISGDDLQSLIAFVRSLRAPGRLSRP